MHRADAGGGTRGPGAVELDAPRRRPELLQQLLPELTVGRGGTKPDDRPEGRETAVRVLQLLLGSLPGGHTAAADTQVPLQRRADLCMGCGLCSYVCPSKIELRSQMLDAQEQVRRELHPEEEAE
ncbi:MAG: 4Fe-4S dicluster domain-containing protein [Planctomycetota bacterium]